MAGPNIGSLLRKIKLPTAHTKTGPSIGPGGVVGTLPKLGGVGINSSTPKISIPGKEVNIGGVIGNIPSTSIGGNSGGIGGLLNKVKLPTAHTKFGAIGPGGFIGKFPGAAGIQSKIDGNGIKAILPSRNINIGGLDFTTPGINETISFKSIFGGDDITELTNTTNLISETQTSSSIKGGLLGVISNTFGKGDPKGLLNTEGSLSTIAKNGLTVKGVRSDGSFIEDKFGNAVPNDLTNTIRDDGEIGFKDNPVSKTQTSSSIKQGPELLGVISNNFGEGDPKGLTNTIRDDGDFGFQDNPVSKTQTSSSIKQGPGLGVISKDFGNADPDDLTNTIRDDGEIGFQDNPVSKTQTSSNIKQGPGLGVISKDFGKGDPVTVKKENIKGGHLIQDLMVKVKSLQLKDYARPTDYEVRMTLPKGVDETFKEFTSRELSFGATSVMHISETLDTIKTNYSEQLYPSTKQLGSLMINFHVGSDMEELKFFRTWMEAIIGTRSHKVAYRDSITMGTLTINQLDRKNRIRYTDEFQDVYPTVITEMALDYGSTNAILKLPVTFAYRVKRLNVPIQPVNDSITPFFRRVSGPDGSFRDNSALDSRQEILASGVGGGGDNFQGGLTD